MEDNVQKRGDGVMRERERERGGGGDTDRDRYREEEEVEKEEKRVRVLGNFIRLYQAVGFISVVCFEKKLRCASYYLVLRFL